MQSGEGPAASFAERAKAATLELTGEDADGLRKPKGALIWDKTKHNFVRPTIGADNKKKIRTESGFMVNASFKSRRYVYCCASYILVRLSDYHMPDSMTGKSGQRFPYRELVN